MRQTTSTSYWTIQIIHGDFYKDWMVKDSDLIWVSAKGYPSMRSLARFESRKHAEEFLDKKREEIDRRCANKYGFIGYEIGEWEVYWPVKYDLPISLKGIGKRGPSRTALYRNGVK